MIVLTVDKQTYTRQPLKKQQDVTITLKNGNDVRKVIEDIASAAQKRQWEK